MEIYILGRKDLFPAFEIIPRLMILEMVCLILFEARKVGDGWKRQQTQQLG